MHDSNGQLKFTWLSLALTCWGLAIAAPALAQTVGGGSFGATRADAGRDTLNVQLSMGQAFESDMPPESRSLAQRSDLQAGGRSTVLAASADYALNRRSVQLFGDATTYFSYAQRLDRIAAGSQSAQFGVGVRLPKQGSLQIAQAAAYSPSYLYQLLPVAAPIAPGDPIPVNPDYRSDQTESYSHQTRMALTFGSARRTRLTATADYRLTDFKKQTVAHPDVVTYSTGARVSRALSRSTALSGGYEYSTGEFGRGGLTKEHRTTIGVVYSAALSVTRRVTFRLEVSPSIFEIPESELTAATTEPIATALEDQVARAVGRQYPLQGEVSVDYPFRLKWRASASYQRNVDYVPGLIQPVFANGARVGLVGIIGHRVEVSGLAGYASASSAISRNTKPLITSTGEARIKYALTRTFALYSAYTYYNYNLGPQAHLAEGLSDVYEQSGIRVGFVLFGQPLGR